MSDQKDKSGRFTARIFKALSDPVRLEIVKFLRTGEKCVCEIVPYLEIPQPLVSRHLKIMKDSGLVKERKEGNRRVYSVSDPQVFAILDAVTPELIDSLSKRVIEQIACWRGIFGRHAGTC
jgi:ArsR family transcriptional regulator